jgi:hypothetical protein
MASISEQEDQEHDCAPEHRDCHERRGRHEREWYRDQQKRRVGLQ